MKKNILLILLLTLVSTLAYSQIDLYQDTRFIEWKSKFVKGNKEELVKSVESDLKSNSPHPYAQHIWYITHKSIGDLETAFEKISEDIKMQIKANFEIESLYEAEKLMDIYKKYPFKKAEQLTDFYSLLTLIWAIEEIDEQYVYDLSFHFLTLYPNSYRSISNFTFLAEENLRIKDRLMLDIKEGKFDNYKKVKLSLQQIFKTSPTNNYDKILAINQFQISYPNDAYSFYYKAIQFNDIENYEKAIESYMNFWKLDPFYTDLYSMALTNAKLQHYTQSDSLLRENCRLYHSNIKEIYYSEFAKLLLDEGNKGKARKILEEGLKNFPESPEINFQYGNLEVASNRLEVSLKYFIKTIQLRPQTTKSYEKLIETYNSLKQYDKAIEMFNKIKEFKINLTENQYHIGSDIYIGLGQLNDAINLLNDAVIVYPSSSWMKRQLAYAYFESNASENSLKVLNQSFELQAPSSWGLNTLESLYNRIYKDEKNKLIEELERVSEIFYWEEDVWVKVAGLKKTDDEKINLWEKAKERNKGRLFPYENMRYIYANQENWEKLNDLYEVAEQEINEFGNERDKTNLQFEKGIIKVSKLRKTRITQFEYESAVNSFNKYLELNGRKGAYYEYLAELYEAVGDQKNAVLCVEKALIYRPDDANYNVSLWTKYGKEYSSSKAAKKYYYYVERDPYDGERLETFASLNVMWNGSPINAICYSKLLKERVPGMFSENIEGMAYGQLGNNAKDYEIRYSRSNIIANSQRYINWYNNSRRNAINSNSKVDIDYENNSATIEFQDGTIALRQDHPIFGKIEKIQIGNSYLKADYNEDGSIIKLKSSAGDSISFGYTKTNITSIISSRESLNISYNQLDKPSEILLKGVGKLVITYNNEGIVDNVSPLKMDGSEGANSIATKVSTVFEKMLSMVNLLEKASDLSTGNLPYIGIQDNMYNSLSTKYEKSDEKININNKPNELDEKKWIESGLDFVSYLVDNTHIKAEYGTESISILDNIFDYISTKNNKKFNIYNVRIISYYYKILNKIRYKGIDNNVWSVWTKMQEWLIQSSIIENNIENRRKMISLLNTIKSQPIQLLKSSEWLPKSYLNNTAYWKKVEFKKIIPSELLSDIKINTSFYRKNGDLLLGTNKGICVFSNGYWQWLYFDDFKKQFTSELSNSKIKSSSDILCIVEDDSLYLYLGTANGLIKLTKGYRNKVDKKYTELDNLVTSRIEHIGYFNDKIYFSADKLYSLENNQIKLVNQNFGNIKFLKTILINDSLSLFIGSNKGVYRLNGNNIITSENLKTGSVDDIIYYDNQLLFLKNNTIVKRTQNNNSEVELYGTIVKTNQVFGLAYIPINKDEITFSVLTDLGLSLYNNNHFEHFYLPFTDKTAQARLFCQNNQNSFSIVTQDAVYLFNSNNIIQYDETVKDIITSDSLGVTFIATGSSLMYISIKDSLSALKNITDYSSTTHLAIDKQNRLIANDGKQITRYTFDLTNNHIDKKELFYANQTENEEYSAGDVSSILIASDSTIWVTAGLSIFRYKEINNLDSAIVEEYNFFKNPDLFPSRTHMINNVTETLDKKIIVTCSNEGHLYYKGISLKGGLLQWIPEEKKFKRLDVDSMNANSYFTSYTPISVNEAIIGTLGSFALEKNGVIENFKTGIKDPSYIAMAKDNPNLFLGTKGAKLGDLYLFGCGAGIVSYLNGSWFYPDRINKLLPKDVEYSNYGSRKVNAITTDKNGKIYIGTDYGLIVYNSGDKNPTGFIINNFNENLASIYQNTNLLRNEADLILPQINKSSKSGKMIDEIKKSEKSIDDFEKLISKENVSLNLYEVNKQKIINKDSLTAVLDDIRKRHKQLLFKLEQQDPGLHQLLTIQPLDLYKLREELSDKNIIVQYIPMSDKLYIHLASKNTLTVKEIFIQRDSLLNICSKTSDNLTRLAKLSIGEINTKRAELNEITMQSLSKLFEILIRPIENDIAGYENVYILPFEDMYYLPFGALINKTSESSYHYAVEDYNFGYLSSMNLLKLVINKKDVNNSNCLLFADPDGTLNGARQEVHSISKYFVKPSIFIGKDATTQAFIDKCANSKIIHLATHGKLDKKNPSESTLLFADRSMNVMEAFDLPLENTEVITLSACQTARGNKGLEYATIARAFINAGAGSIIATLWQIDDDASKTIMANFYENLLNSNNKYKALTNAQRQMIKSENISYRHPSKWSAFIPMGKP